MIGWFQNPLERSSLELMNVQYIGKTRRDMLECGTSIETPFLPLSTESVLSKQEAEGVRSHDKKRTVHLGVSFR
jgi:hypothetical protein